MNVYLFVEGGGNSRALHSQCREAFRVLLEKAGFNGCMPRIVACGSRNEAFDRFRNEHRDRGPDDYPILLVDSEDPVTQTPWAHLKARDGWQPPADAEDEQAQLMVTCMETWIVADPESLKRIFGSDFKPGALPPVSGLESRTRDEVQDKLEAATRACPRERRYEKGRRSFQALAAVDPAILGPRLPHFRRLVDTLAGLG